MFANNGLAEQLYNRNDKFDEEEEERQLKFVDFVLERDMKDPKFFVS